jgi:tetratricopeptide (TPR) repeat protein
LSAEELTLPQFEHEVQAWFTLNPALETVELCFSETLTSNVSEKDEDEDDSEAMSDSGEDDSEAMSELDKGEDFMCESAGRIGDLDSRVLMRRQALDCDPNDDVLLTGLASLLQRRSQETGNQSDIHEAIAIFESLIEISADDSVRCSRYNGLGSALTILYRQTKSVGDLDRAIAMTKKAIQTAPDGWPDRGTYLTNLGNLLIERFEKERSMCILDWAISTNTIPVHLISDDHLTNLGNKLMERLEKEKSMHILDQAISTLTNAVEFTPDDHPNRGPAFYNLGSALLQRFKMKGSVNDLHSSTTALAQARNFTPEEGDDHAKLRAKIRDACELKSSNGVSSLSDFQLQLWATCS